MKRTLATLALTAGLALSCSPALAMGEDCTTSTEVISVLITPEVPAVPAIPGTPAVYETVIEYEFTHAQDGNGQGQGQGPENKWVTDPEWNAEGNPNSVGWVATGNTREVVTDTVLVPAVDAVPAIPAIPAVYEQQEIPVTTCKPVPEVPCEEGKVKVEDGTCVPASFFEEPVKAEPVAEPAPETAVRPAVVPAPQEPAALAQVGATSDLPKELAHTGPADWALPTAVVLLAAGGTMVALRRKVA